VGQGLLALDARGGSGLSYNIHSSTQTSATFAVGGGGGRMAQNGASTGADWHKPKR